MPRRSSHVTKVSLGQPGHRGRIAIAELPLAFTWSSQDPEYLRAQPLGSLALPVVTLVNLGRPSPGTAGLPEQKIFHNEITLAAWE